MADDVGSLAAAQEVGRGEGRRVAGAKLGEAGRDGVRLAAAEIGQCGIVPAADPAFDMMDRLRMGDDVQSFHAGLHIQCVPRMWGLVYPRFS